MPTRKPSDNIGKSISIPGLLGLMTGGGLLYSYSRFEWATETSLTWKVVVLGGSVLLVVWGFCDIVRGLFSDDHGQRHRRRPADPSTPARTNRMLFLFGLLMMAGSLSLGTLIAIRAESSLTVVLAIGGGVLMFMGGLRNVVTALMPVRARPRSHRRQRLPLPGVVYLVMMSSFFVGSLIGRSNMLMLVFSFMAGPFIVNGWVTLRMLSMTRVSRKLQQRVMAGEPLDVELTIENGKSVMSSWLMDVTDRIVGAGEELQTGVLFTCVPPGQSRTESYQLRLMQRGRYRFGPLVVNSRFPLGFVERGLEFDSDGEIIVFPRLGRLTAAWDQDSLMAMELVEKEDSRPGIYDDEFHRLREYRWGDNPRDIHWRTAARKNELMVREYHQSRDRDLVILLDLWNPGKWNPENPGDEDFIRVETAVSFAATVAIDHMRNSRESIVTLIASGKTLERWQGQAGTAAFDSLLEILALLEPGKSHDIEVLQQEAGVSTSSAVRTILITTHTDRLQEPAAASEPFADRAVLTQLESFVADPELLSRYFLLPASGEA